MTSENQGTTGAAGGTGAAPPPTPAPAKVEPKFEVKEGSYFVDGKKMVAESDLIAAKRSLETQMQTQQEAHTQAIDTARLELSDAQKQVATLNAELTKAREARGQGATTDEEVARITQELADAKKSVETLTAEAAKSLELKRQLLITQYPGVTAEQLADKTMTQLDSFEEALKALAGGRGGGPGPYAIGGAGAGAAQMTDMERAAKVLENTPQRGVRTAQTA